MIICVLGIRIITIGVKAMCWQFCPGLLQQFLVTFSSDISTFFLILCCHIFCDWCLLEVDTYGSHFLNFIWTTCQWFYILNQAMHLLVTCKYSFYWPLHSAGITKHMIAPNKLVDRHSSLEWDTYKLRRFLVSCQSRQNLLKITSQTEWHFLYIVRC